MTGFRHKDIPASERLIFALDVPDAGAAKELVIGLGPAVTFYKIGMELMASGEFFEVLDWLLANDKKVFADLKLFDIPPTVGRAVSRLRTRGAHFLTVHGNQSIMEAAAAAKGDVGILAVTVLTSLDRGDLDDLGFDCDVEQLVLSRARRALEAGCDGVVSSGLEAPRLRQFVDDKLVVVTPGIRPVDNRPTDDQKRVVSVPQAFGNGADYIVVGRPIRDAEDPRAAADRQVTASRASTAATNSSPGERISRQLLYSSMLGDSSYSRVSVLVRRTTFSPLPLIRNMPVSISPSSRSSPRANSSSGSAAWTSSATSSGVSPRNRANWIGISRSSGIEGMLAYVTGWR